jgi:DNA (cytosine-5)-methyltransferase 1
MAIITAVDLFCGAGGLTNGLIKSKVNVVAGFDIEESCRYAYEKNNRGARFINSDVSTLSSKEVLSFYPKGHIKLLAGCAPCQPFSTYSQGRDALKDKKWPLLYAFSRLIREVKPELVTMENVPDVTKHKVYHDFVQELIDLGYNVWAERVFCPDYGMPQVRKRHVLLASKIGPIELIKPTHKPKNYKTVIEVIGNLPPIKAGQKNIKDPLHISAGLSELNMKRIKISKPGGTWNDWPEGLRADCHKKQSGRTYSGVYARMRWDKPSPTMTTQCFGYGNGRFGHPSQDRAISLREAALLQTFPKSYKFIQPNEKPQMTVIGKMIGNAVPVDLGKLIGESLYKHVA